MERYSRYSLTIARILISIVFLLNAVGVIDQTIPAKEMAERGVRAELVPWLMLAGRALELVAGLSLSFGVYPRFAALALLAFLVPATFVSHSFWSGFGTKAFQPQLISFSKNIAIWGGLLFVAGASTQPRIARLRSAKPTSDFSVAQRRETQA